MYVNPNTLYANRLAEDVNKTYEENTGDKIKPGEDLTKVVEFYGILVEFEKLDMDCVNIYSKIIKTQDTYKIIFDEEYAIKLKESGMGNWNFFLGKMLGHIMLQPNDIFESAEEGTIFYPEQETMQEYYWKISKKSKEEERKKKELLSQLDRLDSGKVRSEIIKELSELDKDLADSKGLSKRKRYKIKGRKIGN